MRILQVHNRYRHHGGEDAILDAERDLLQHFGHEVHRYLKDNRSATGLDSAAMALTGVWSAGVYREFRATVRRLKPDVAHVHNTMPLISPAVYHASIAEGVPVVQTLHNYRLLCINGQFLREGSVCEKCLGTRLLLPGLRHRCYRGSLTASAAVGAMLTVHRALSTWRSKITRYIALTDFARDKFIAGGLPARRIRTKPNFVPDPGFSPWSRAQRSGALYVGRLSAEKGVETLVRAWNRDDGPLHIVGSGPLRGRLEQTAGPNVHFLGRLDKPEVIERMRRAELLIVPSVCYETFSLVSAEAFAVGLPVLASRIGALAENVVEGSTGIAFEPGDVRDLKEKVRLARRDDELMQRIVAGARERYESRFTMERNHDLLLSIYREAVAELRDGGGTSP